MLAVCAMVMLLIDAGHCQVSVGPSVTWQLFSGWFHIDLTLTVQPACEVEVQS